MRIYIAVTLLTDRRARYLRAIQLTSAMNFLTDELGGICEPFNQPQPMGRVLDP